MSTNVGHLQATLGLNTMGLTRGLKQAQASLMKSGKRMKAIGRSMTMALTLPLAAIGVGAVKMAADFESSMTKIVSLVGVAQDSVNDMKSSVLDLAGEVAKSPKELADALFFITSAGLRGAEALEVLESSAKASASGLGETKVVADLVTSAMNAYGSEVLNAGKATDILVATVREGKAEAPELAAAMGQVLPIASALGVSFDQVGASIAAMTRTGTNAGTAAIQLRQILASILKPSQQAEDGFLAMGSSGVKLRKMLKDDGLLAVFTFLKENVAGNASAAEKLTKAYGDAFPNIRALSGALDIMGANSEDNVDIYKRMTDVLGLNDKAFAVTADTMSHQFNQALADIKVSAVELGTTLLPIASKILNWVRDAVGWFSGLSATTKKWGLSIAGILLLAGPLIAFFGTIATLIAGITWPILAVIAAVAALTAAFVYVSENWDAIVERLGDWTWWKNMLLDMAIFLIKYNPAALIWKGFKMVIPLIVKAWDKLIEKVSDVTWWKNMLTKMLAFFIKWNPFSRMMKDVAWLTGEVIPEIGDSYEKVMSGMEDEAGNFDWGAFLTDPFEQLASGLEALKGETKEYEHQFGTFMDAMRSAIAKTKAALVGMFDSASGGGGGGGKEAAPDFTLDEIDYGGILMENLENSGYQQALEEPVVAFNNMTSQITEDYSEWQARIKKMQDTDRSRWSDWLWSLSEMWKNAPVTLANGMDALRLVFSDAIDVLGSLSGLMTSVFVSLGESIGAAFSGTADEFSSPLQKILLIVADFAKQFGAMLISIGSLMVITGIFSGIGGILIGAGVALVALGSAGAGLINKKIDENRKAAQEGGSPRSMQGLASGGFVVQGGIFQLHKDEMVSLPAGSAVTPAGMASGTQEVAVHGILRGEDIYLASEEYKRKLGNTKG